MIGRGGKTIEKEKGEEERVAKDWNNDIRKRGLQDWRTEQEAKKEVRGNIESKIEEITGIEDHQEDRGVRGDSVQKSGKRKK